MAGPIVLIALIVIIVIILIRNIRIVQQAKAYVIERLGAYKTTWNVGMHLKVPFIERVAKIVSLKEQVADFPPQPVITKDNVTMQIDTVVYFQITDPKLYTYGIEQPMIAIENLAATTLRNIIGDLELDQCLTSRDIINTKMRAILDEATDPWGIKVNRVELKNIIPPKEIQAAMEKAVTFEEFASILSRSGITVKESRGRFSYLTTDRIKPITSRKLGDDYSKEAVLSRLQKNAERPVTPDFDMEMQETSTSGQKPRRELSRRSTNHLVSSGSRVRFPIMVSLFIRISLLQPSLNGSGFRRRFLDGRGLLQLVHSLHDGKQAQRHDEEVNNGIDEIADSDTANLDRREIRLTENHANNGSQDVFHNACDDRAKSRTDDHTDCHIQDIALHGKLFEFLD